MKSARQIAVEALITINDNKGYSNLVLDSVINKNEISKKDVGFISTIIYGTIERLITLDFIISKYSSMKIRKMSPAVREILRTAIYQIIYMDSVPDSAAVNEAVNLTKVMKVKSASGFVNGVLRSFLRDGGKIPKITGGKIRKISVKYSCPEPLVKLLIEQYGGETAKAVLMHTMGGQNIYCRVNTLKTTADKLVKLLENEGVDASKDDEVENCLRLQSTGSIQNLTCYKEGLFHIQDKSSQIAVGFLNAHKDDCVLDVCSAPGGKTCTIAQLMENKGEITACDIYEHKVKLVSDGAQRLGITSINAKINNGEIYDETLGKFNRILCDVPCSGIGIMGRKPEIKYKDWNNLDDLEKIQYKILETSSKYLLKGGILLYSTCTLNKKENEEVVSKFLSNHSEFEALPMEGHKADGYTTLLPNEDDCDGFFFATLKKIR